MESSLPTSAHWSRWKLWKTFNFMTTFIVITLILVASFATGLLVGIKHAEKGRAIKDAIKK